MERCFEKISFDQFKKDIKDDIDLYNEFSLPERKTKYSAGYDFAAIEGFELNPGEIKKIPLGVKAKVMEDEYLMIVVRSSMGFKHNVRMTNQVGIVDYDYYNNPENEGHIWLSLENHGDKVFKVEKGNGICQGIISKYYTTSDTVTNERIGGYGSTDRKEEQ